MAAHFGSVPETGVPVTRAHDDSAGKVGDLEALEARPDGLWGRIRWTLVGARLLAEGAFRYLSPEIVWGPTDYDGRRVRNVLTGLSLVNRPFFGRPVSLFWLRPAKQSYQHKESIYMEEPVPNTSDEQGPPDAAPQAPAPPRGLIDRLFDWLATRLIAWLWPKGRQAMARVEQLDAQEAQYALRQHFGALENAGLGAGWTARLARLARTDAALADEIATKFQALLTQNAHAALFNEIGISGAQAAGPVERFNAAVKTAVHSYGLSYADAGQKVAVEQPELYAEYRTAVTNRL